VSEITRSEVNKRVKTVWHQWCARCVWVRVWTGIRRIFLIHVWNAKSLFDESCWFS